MTNRTPLKTTKNILRNRKTQAALYKKIVTIPLTGTNPEELQQVAATIHLAAANHPLVLGGKFKRKVFVNKTDSDIPLKIFDGIV